MLRFQRLRWARDGLYALQEHVGGDFKDYDTEEHHLVSEIDVGLGDLDVVFEAARERAGEIHTVKLEDEEAEEEEWEDREVDSAKVLAGLSGSQISKNRRGEDRIPTSIEHAMMLPFLHRR